MGLTPVIKDNDWGSVRRAIQKLNLRLGVDSTPTFAGLSIGGLTASRLISTDADKDLASVTDLTSWIAQTANQVLIADDGDGTITLSTPQDIHTGANPTFNNITAGNNFFASTGAVGSPAWSFTDYPTSGIYYAPGSVGVTIVDAGSKIASFDIAGNIDFHYGLTMNSNSITGVTQIRGSDGTVSAPLYSFTDDPTSGVYNDGGDVLISVSNNLLARFGSPILFYNPLNIGANAFTVNSNEIVGSDGEVNAAVIEDKFLRNDASDLTSGTLTAAGFNIAATIDHTLTNSSDDLVISNLNQDKDIIFSVNDGGTQKSFITIDSSKSALILDPGTINGIFGLIDCAGTYTTGNSYILNFHPIYSGAGGISGINIDINLTGTGNTVGQGIWITGNTSASQSSGTQTLYQLRLEPDLKSSDQTSDAYGLYFKPAQLALVHAGTKGIYGNYIEIPLTIAIAGTVNQYGIYLKGWGTTGEAGGTINSRAYYSDGGDEIHAGNVRIGSTVAPTVTLDVTGDSKFNGIVTFPKASGNGIKIDIATPTFGWRDLLGEPTTKNTGATKPSYETYNGAIDGFRYSDGDEEQHEYHIPHDYVLGTDIYLHIHWSQISTTNTGGTIDFKYSAIYSKGHNQAAFTSTPITDVITSADAGSTRYQHFITEQIISGASATAALFDRDDIEPDGVILLTLEMDVNNLTDSSAVTDPFIHFVDIHYQSTNIATKDKVPDFYS